MKSRVARLKIGILVALALGLTPFTNCSSPNKSPSSVASSNIADPAQSSRLDYNGGGYSGKLTYNHYSALPQCSMSAGPEKQIEVVADQAALIENSCSTATSTPISTADLISNDYDPYYMVYNELIYANSPTIGARQPGQRTVIWAYCTSPSEGVDFAVRLEQVWNNGWQTSVFGDLITATPGQAPVRETVAGRLHDMPANQILFTSTQNQIRFEGQADSAAPTHGTGRLTLSTGHTMSLPCYFLPRNKSGH